MQKRACLATDAVRGDSSCNEEACNVFVEEALCSCIERKGSYDSTMACWHCAPIDEFDDQRTFDPATSSDSYEGSASPVLTPPVERPLKKACSAPTDLRPAAPQPEGEGAVLKTARGSEPPLSAVVDLPAEAGGGEAGAGLALSNKAIAANVQSVLAQQPGVSGAEVEEVTKMLENATIGNIKLLDLLPSVVRGALKPALKEMCIVCGLEDGGLVEELKSRLWVARALLRDGRNVGPAGAGEMHPPAPDVPDQGSDDEEGASSTRRVRLHDPRQSTSREDARPRVRRACRDRASERPLFARRRTPRKSRPGK